MNKIWILLSLCIAQASFATTTQSYSLPIKALSNASHSFNQITLDVTTGDDSSTMTVIVTLKDGDDSHNSTFTLNGSKSPSSKWLWAEGDTENCYGEADAWCLMSSLDLYFSNNQTVSGKFSKRLIQNMNESVSLDVTF
jgi:hypothetical protein